MIEKNSAVIHKYDTTEFPFKKIVDNHFNSQLGVSSEDLHTLQDDGLFPSDIVRPGSDNNTALHNILYTVFDGHDFLPTYRTFVKYLQAHFQEDLVFQKKPTFRIHLPRNLSVGNYHRDRDYFHPMEEVNVWFPVTQAKGTATIWMESEYGREDFQPKELDVGEFLVFDSGLKHGNEINLEGYTRVSFDFRVIPKRLFTDSQHVTANRGHKFALGHYYDQF